MRYFVIFIVLVNTISCTSVEKYKFKEVGWTLIVPSSSTILTPIEKDSLHKLTSPGIKLEPDPQKSDSSLKLKLVPSITTNRLSINLGNNGNYFFIRIDTLIDEQNWEQTISNEQSQKLIFFKENEKYSPLLDYAFSSETVGSVDFRKSFYKTKNENTTSTEYNYMCKRGHHRYAFLITYIDEDIGKGYLELLKNSKFE